ncbi:GTP-binding protein Rho3 [Grifola frondosa]|uniref:GTP-binding protein Rho3 n=1 Tax=Grifola frondosa TaxID=5627 RepID=A0A1C7LNS7_GRIFR|nr:GTP-binding protein Rho3 [Grifola frondosa]
MSSNDPNLLNHLDTPPQDLANVTKKKKRGATRLSCAECRRLKLRCDRAIPCGSCVKRGCAAICPDGSLTTGKGNRFVLASTQDLHEKINQLATRVRELEDALRVSHGLHSLESHPLLSEDLLRIKAPIQRDNLLQNATSSTNGSSHDDQNADVVDSFGSLAISDTGRTNYFGQATSSWYYLTNEDNQDEDRDQRLANLRKLLSPEVLSLSGLFPVAPNIPLTLDAETQRIERLRSLFWYLPPADEAAELRQIYYQHAAWMYNPISLAQFNENAFYPFYSPNASPQMDDPLLSHQLALMFMVLAIGSLMDITRPSYNIEADKYHHLARAALFQSPYSRNRPSMPFRPSGVGSRWAFMGLAVKLGISMGLHRDAGRWKVEPAEIQRRRECFWELYSYDLLQSFTLGRPPSFSLTHVDCKKPFTEDPNNEETFHWWKHKFTSECMNQVYDQAFGAKTPTNSVVQQLDRRLRGFAVPPSLQIAGFGSSESRLGTYYESVPLILQRHTVLAIRESHLLYMHRGFFARAISDHPKDPFGSPYGASFIAAYRSAGSLVALVRNIHSQLKELTERMWFLWTHLFSCSIILGSIVTRCPSMSLAPSALVQLDSACDLFAKTARHFHAEKVLGIMLRLREKAHASLVAYRNTPPSRHGTLSEPSTPADDNDELNILGGRTRLVAQKEKSMSPQITDRSPTSLNPIVPLPLREANDQQIHPYVLQYLRTFVPSPHQQASSSQVMHQQAMQMASQQSSPTQQTHIPNLQPITTSFGSGSEALQSPAGLQMEGMVPTFPQYFPVFDYGHASGSGEMFIPSPVPMDSDFSGRSYSPEASMQTAWQEFVAQIGMSAPSSTSTASATQQRIKLECLHARAPQYRLPLDAPDLSRERWSSAEMVPAARRHYSTCSLAAGFPRSSAHYVLENSGALTQAPPHSEPTVFENYVHDLYVDDQLVELSLWDTAGQEEFDRLRSLSYAETHVIMCCFSVDNPTSLDNVEAKVGISCGLTRLSLIDMQWIDEILEYCPGLSLSLSVTLKCDLREDRATQERLARYGMHTVQYEEGLTVARRIRASRYLGVLRPSISPSHACYVLTRGPSECSAKHNRGVNEVFYEAARVSLSTRAKGSGNYGGRGGCVIL